MRRNQHNLKLPEDQQDQRLRDQLFEGCRLARELDERLKSIPPGKLGVASNTQLRSSLAIASAEAIAAFNEAIKLVLLPSTNHPSNPTLIAATNSPRQCVDQPLPPPKRTFNSAVGKGLAAEQGPSKRNSPPLSPHGLAVISANVGSINYKRLSPSPPRSMNSPTSEMSDGSPNNDGAETADATTTNAKENPRKRTLLPKVTLKMPAGNLDQGGDCTPPDDGHTWRKYGQKEILGARFPRSYYRCTYKNDLGCMATKQVQRCDEDCSVYDVTYKGHHTCRSAERENQCWPFAFQHSLFPFANHVLPLINTNNANANLNLLPSLVQFSHSNPASPKKLALPASNQLLPLKPNYPNYHDDSHSSLLQPTFEETRKVPEGSGKSTSAADNSKDSSRSDGSFGLQFNVSKGTSTILGPNSEKEILGSKQPQLPSTPMWPLVKKRDYAMPSLTTSEAMASPQATSTRPSRNHEQVRSFGEPMESEVENPLPNDEQDDVPNSSTFDNMDLLGFLESMDSDPGP